jgi:hypothetical protein
LYPCKQKPYPLKTQFKIENLIDENKGKMLVYLKRKYIPHPRELSQGEGEQDGINQLKTETSKADGIFENHENVKGAQQRIGRQKERGRPRDNCDE